MQTIDGVAALPVQQSNRLIADRSDADHFVMALLRACADVVLVGSATVRASPNARWTAEAAYPRFAEGMRDLRRRLGLGERPAIAIVTSGVGLPVGLPVLQRAPIVLTTEAGAERLGPELPGCDVVALPGGERVDVRAAVDALRAGGHRRILFEGGVDERGSLRSSRECGPHQCEAESAQCSGPSDEGEGLTPRGKAVERRRAATTSFLIPVLDLGVETPEELSRFSDCHERRRQREKRKPLQIDEQVLRLRLGAR